MYECVCVYANKHVCVCVCANKCVCVSVYMYLRLYMCASYI